MSQPNRFPDYVDVAPTARTVVIGTVVETRPYPDEDSVVFSLRVDDVIRGNPPATMELEVLRSGLPLRGSDACRADAALHVHAGDVIALALDGRLGGPQKVNTAAWIGGRPDEWVPGVRVMSRQEALAAARPLPPTDTSTDLGVGPDLDVTRMVYLVQRSLAGARDGIAGAATPH